MLSERSKLALEIAKLRKKVITHQKRRDAIQREYEAAMTVSSQRSLARNLDNEDELIALLLDGIKSTQEYLDTFSKEHP